MQIEVQANTHKLKNVAYSQKLSKHLKKKAALPVVVSIGEKKCES